MKTYDYGVLSEKEIAELCKRKGADLQKIFPIVQGIEKLVVEKRDKALQELSNKFDEVDLDVFLVSDQEYKEAAGLVSEELKEAIKTARDNITKFHKTQLIQEPKVEVMSGVTCWRESRAIEKVGLYIPGGTAPLFSTILMSAIPAQVAGSEKIILCTPPGRGTGKVAPEILWTADLLGIREVYKVGGAQAIFAMTYGTEQIPAVDKIFGPGNQFVTVAKIIASQRVAIDMPAGPSEVLVIADQTSNAEFVAADLLSQAEHGTDSEVVLVCTSEAKIREVETRLIASLQTLPRKEIAERALSNSYCVKVDNMEEAVTFSNKYAPEHLIIAFENYQSLLPNIKNAGSVFCGPYACESFGDYASGTNHILPTSAFARNYSGVSVDSFMKKVTFQDLTKEGCKTLGPSVELMAAAEELQAHKNAVTVRLNSIS